MVCLQELVDSQTQHLELQMRKQVVGGPCVGCVLTLLGPSAGLCTALIVQSTARTWFNEATRLLEGTLVVFHH